jgi:hypothetical protein
MRAGALQGFRNESLTKALDDGIRGDARALFELLARVGGLPGPRANQGVIDAFAAECIARGAAADALVAKMATLDVDAAPGATKYEIIPMCGVTALGARAAADPAAMRALSTLHDCAEDLRFRVRECVSAALAHIGEARGEPLVHDLAPWMDGFFHAAAVLSALSDAKWLARVKAPEPVIERLEEAFALAKNATRASSRYPGFKALLETLLVAPAEAGARFGVPVFDMLVRWAQVKDPVLRELVEKIAQSPKLTGRYAEQAVRVHAALDETAPARRDPRTYVGPTRGRGRKRGR